MPPFGVRFESETADKGNKRKEKSTCKGSKEPYMQVDLLFLLTVFDPHTFKDQLCQQTQIANPYFQTTLSKSLTGFGEFTEPGFQRLPLLTRLSEAL